MSDKEKQCGICKKTLSDFYSSGMLGCPECYYYFGAEVQNAVKKIQGKTVHVGKKPVFSDAERELFGEYQKLKEMAENAEQNGDFSFIDSIIVELEELEQELTKRGLI